MWDLLTYALPRIGVALGAGYGTAVRMLKINPTAWDSGGEPELVSASTRFTATGRFDGWVTGGSAPISCVPSELTQYQ